MRTPGICVDVEGYRQILGKIGYQDVDCEQTKFECKSCLLIGESEEKIILRNFLLIYKNHSLPNISKLYFLILKPEDYICLHVECFS